MRSPSWAVLSLLLALPAGAARSSRLKQMVAKPRAAPEKPDPARARMKEIRDELEAMELKLSPLVDELKQLSDTYSTAADPRTLIERRTALHTGLTKALEQHIQLEDEFSSMRSNADVGNIALLIKSFASGQGLPPGMEAGYFQYNDALEFSRNTRSFRENANRVLASDEIQFQAAMQAFEQHQRWMVATWAAGGLVVVVIGALLFWRHRQARGAYAVTGSTGEQVVLGGDPSAQGALPAPGPDMPPPAEAEPGAVLGGNYRIERVLGRGGMGVVYEATDLTLQRKVAIKRMTDELLQAGHDLELFVNEARLVAQLKHPHIVEIHSILREGGLLHLVFEYVEGKPLSAFLERGSRVTLKSAKGVVRQVGSALDYAHSRKVVHRDLKPANIMVGQGGAIKVMDFGIAHQARLTVAKITRTGAWGTPPYMAPEQELGQVSRESDLFALGVCLYEMVTAQLPFSGPNFLAQKRERIYRPPTKVASGLPPELDAVIHRALSPDPKDRFHSGAEFIAAVEALTG
ncbi:MAG: serine/threonine protein kinase [Elusimicrobia bacterium]|nr:serine/threonine protein kinase [Elusimicrobiota bacterium]